MDAAGSVVLRPPVEVVQPMPVADIPAEDAFPDGPAWYEPKLDGYRATGWHLPEGSRLISRRQVDLSPMVPDVLAQLVRLPVGTVVDGELCAVVEGKMEFAALARRRGRDRSLWPPVAYVLFDLLALPGRDTRGLPLRQRRELLEQVLTESVVGLPVQMLFGTRDRETAAAWYEGGMRRVGSEGLVVKPLNSRYEPGARWRKVRHADTLDGRLVAVIGSVQRPSAVVVELPDGRRMATSPRLNPVQARQVADAVAGQVGEVQASSDQGQIRPVTADPPIRIEVRAGSGRHAVARYVRARPREA